MIRELKFLLFHKFMLRQCFVKINFLLSHCFHLILFQILGIGYYNIKDMLKKAFLVLSLFLVVFFLSGCGPVRPNRTLLSYVGVMDQEGRYFVIKTDDDQFRIRSVFLDLTPYLRKKVKIHGQFSQSLFFVDDVKLAQ